MSPSVAPAVAPPASRSVTVAGAMAEAMAVLPATCTRPFAPSAARPPRSHSNREATGQSTAAIAFPSAHRFAADTRRDPPTPALNSRQEVPEPRTPVARYAVQRRMQLTTLLVGNLSPKTTASDLQTVFSAFGEIASLRIARDQAGHTRGFALVDLEHRAAAVAVQALKGVELRGQTIDVTVDRPLSDGGRQVARGGSSKHRNLSLGQRQRTVHNPIPVSRRVSK
jgi:hypothetical protein